MAKRRSFSAILMVAGFLIVSVILSSCPTGPNGNHTPNDIGTTPFIVTVFPPDASELISVFPTVSITFSKEIQGSDIESSIRFYTAEGDVDFQHSFAGTVLQFEPITELAEGTLHHVEIDQYYIVDLSGETMTESYAWSFTTGLDEHPPTVCSVSPYDAMIDVARSSPVTIEFSEEMDIYSVASAFSLRDTASLIPGTFTWSDTTMIFTPNSPLEAATYFVSVSTEAADDSNNRLVSEYALSFTCGYAVSICAGWRHTIAIMSGGTAKGWGYNIYGQAGAGDSVYRNTPGAIEGTSDVVAAAGGRYHSVALLSDGTLRAWGSGYSGQLGDGTTGESRSPVMVTGVSDAVAISAGMGSHNLAVRSNGTVLSWGSNGYGQLGNGSMTGSSIPVPVEGITTAAAVAVGAEHSLALLSDGSVVSWGRNNRGQLGTGDAVDSSIPVAVSGITSAVAIAAGAYHSLALLENGTVMAWGADSRGQLGDGFDNGDKSIPVSADQSVVQNATSIAAGEGHSVALLADGIIVGWGDNTYGQIGGGLGALSYPIPIATASFSDTVLIAAGGDHTHALFPSGLVRSWGNNSYGQLGNGGYLSSDTPVEVIDL